MRMVNSEMNKMLWRRIMYYMQARRIPISRLAKVSGYSYKGIHKSKCACSAPAWYRLMAMSDEIGITLEELCDIRIPVDSVELPPPNPLKPGMDNFTDEKREYFMGLCMKDTRKILAGLGVTLPDAPVMQ